MNVRQVDYCVCFQLAEILILNFTKPFIIQAIVIKYKECNQIYENC